MSLRSEQLTTKYTLCSVLFFYPIPMFSLDQNTLQYINLSSGGREMPKTTTTTTTPPTIKPENYAHSPVHYAVVLADHTTLSTIISTLPSPPDPSQILTDSDSLTQERIADYISTVLDRRDVPFRETPLHLAVRLNDIFAVRALATAGADASLQNSAGWNAIQEALCRRTSDFALVLLNLHHRNAWSKWRRRLPRVLAALHRMRDFYMEMSFHFESSVIPFVGKIAPSDTYKIWKRDGNLRADTSLAGFDGLKIQRADQSFLFLGDGDQARDIPSGSLLVLNRDDRSVFDPFENAGGPMSEADVAAFCSQTSVYRPGMDVTKAELVGRTNWRKQEKTESVGEWKAKVYDVQNVVFSFRSRKIAGAAGSEQVLDEDDEGFLAAEKKREWVPQPRTKEKEYVKSLRPSIWLTEQFPLKTEELLPLLDILANKVKAVRRLRELLTTKLPPGTFPVKVRALWENNIFIFF